MPTLKEEVSKSGKGNMKPPAPAPAAKRSIKATGKQSAAVPGKQSASAAVKGSVAAEVQMGIKAQNFYKSPVKKSAPQIKVSTIGFRWRYPNDRLTIFNAILTVLRIRIRDLALFDSGHPASYGGRTF
jgi:hypothetical protein